MRRNGNRRSLHRAGGSSYAALKLPKNAVKTRNIAPNAVTAPKVEKGSLRLEDFGRGQLPSPDTPSQVRSKLAQVDGSGSGLDADLFDGLTSNDLQHRGSTTDCTGSDKVTGLQASGDVSCGPEGTTPSGAAGGDLDGSYPNPTLRAPEAAHFVGAAGEPPFENGWGNLGFGWASVGFRKDRAGVVHLEGVLDTTGRSAGSRIFGLPSGYRPCSNTIVAGQSGTGIGRIDIINQNIDGEGVIAQSFTASSHLSLTGISFVAC
jgi:hypothetical protein